MHNNKPPAFSHLTLSLSQPWLMSTVVHLFTSSPYLKVPVLLCSARKIEWFNQWDGGERGRNGQRLDHCTDVSDVMHPAHNSICAAHSFSLHPSIQGKQVNRSREKRRWAWSCKPCVSHLECNQPLEDQVTTPLDCRWKRGRWESTKKRALTHGGLFFTLLTSKLLISLNKTYLYGCL